MTPDKGLNSDISSLEYITMENLTTYTPDFTAQQMYLDCGAVICDTCQCRQDVVESSLTLGSAPHLFL